jgi:hypothetical protein
MSAVQADHYSLDPEIAYDWRRAAEERERALAADNISARAAHHELALAYERRIWQRDPHVIARLRRC